MGFTLWKLQTCISEKGQVSFHDRERFLLETPGCFLSTPDVTPNSTKQAEQSSEVYEFIIGVR
jgi:hypothetical protein